MSTTGDVISDDDPVALDDNTSRLQPVIAVNENELRRNDVIEERSIFSVNIDNGMIIFGISIQGWSFRNV